MPRSLVLESKFRLVLISFLVLITGIHLFANDVKQEAVSWAYKYSFDNGIEVTHIVPSTTSLARNGGFLVAGGNALLKLNSLGQPEWQKSYSCLCSISVVVQSSQNGYLAASTVDSLDESYVILLRIDEGGNLIWSKRYRRNSFDSVHSLIRTKDGGYLLGAFSAGLRSKKDGKAWLVKIGGTGSIQWQKTYNVASPDSIHQLKNGDFLIGTDQFSVLRLTHSGKVLWQKKFTADGCCSDGILRVVGENGFIFSGNQLKNSAYNVVVLRADFSGSILFTKTYAKQILQDFKPTLDDGYIILSRKTKFGSPEKVSLTKIDKDGNISWRRVSTFKDLIFPLTVLQASDEGYLVTSLDNFVLKLDQFGNLPNACRNVVTSAATIVGSITMTAENRVPTVAATKAVPVIETNSSFDVLPIVGSICSP